MKKKILLIVICIIAILSGFAFFVNRKNSTSTQTVHYHAGFVVFNNDKKKDFSAIQYMNISPCSISKKTSSDTSDPQLEKAHLHDGVGDLVHIEHSGALWKDLFTNIHYPLPYARATGYINGHKIDNFQNQPIHQYDSLVVFIGSNDIQKDLMQQVSLEYMKVKEKKSDNCGT